MNTRLMEYMIAISEEKSLSRAADRLLISQPALTQQVKKLEKELDTRLFRREKNQLILTDAGKIYVNGARSALSIYYHALEEIRNLRMSGRRKLTVVKGSHLLPEFLQKVLPEFSKKHPELFLNLICGNASVAADYLLNGMADLAVMPAAEPSNSLLQYFPLQKDELLLALPAGHPMTCLLPAAISDLSLLALEPFILHQEGSYFLNHEQSLFAASHFMPAVLCEISDDDTAKKMVAEGKGAAFLPRSLSAPDDGCAYFPLNPPAYYHIVIACHQSSVISGPIRDLILLLLNIYGEP